MSTLLITHPSFLLHDTGPGHPERPDRMRAIDMALGHEAFAGLVRAEAPMRDDVEAAIVRAHSPRYLAALKAARPQPGAASIHLDADTVMSSGSWNAAMHAVGAGLMAVDAVMAGRHSNAFAQVRPCGHHAETDRAMGFCLFNNVAIAALYARHAFGAERIAVIDFDVHHGNGTQNIFWADKDLFLGSIHQMPLYPGTGALSEIGVGNICNAPLRAGDGGEPFRDAILSRLVPALHNFSPDLILLSAGFDAHADDPLAELRLVESDYAWVTQIMADVAHNHCGGRLVSILEGGYDLRALARSVAAHVNGLMDAAS